MKKQISSVIFIWLVVLGTQAQNTDYLSLVDPLIGTAHCRWFHFAPGASVLGMAKPGPSTNGSYGNHHGWDATGYDYRHTTIESFPNFHEFQVGGVALMATEGELKTVPGTLEDPDNGYRSRFDRTDELASPGYYRVLLKDYGVTAELTSTERVSFHRYTFPKTNAANIIFDIGHVMGESGKVKDAYVTIQEDGRVEGYVITVPRYVEKYQEGSDIRMYFTAVLTKRPIRHGVFKQAHQTPDATEARGEGAGAYLIFETGDQEQIDIKIGLSYTSIEHARLNLEAEASNLIFDQARKQNQGKWKTMLGRIDVKGGKLADQKKFYTGLYHALLGRGLASDVNGAYPMTDGGVGYIPRGADGKPLHQHYNTDAVWGAFWNLTQLWALVYPEQLSEFIKSQLLVYNDSGWLADGIANSKYVSGVGTNFVSLVIASAYLNGIKDFDVDQGYQAALKNEIAHEGRPRGAGKLDVGKFVELGFVDHQDSGNDWAETWQFSASHTLEYSFSAYAVAQFAKSLGKKDDYNKLIKLSDGWKHIFDHELKLVRPKYANGKFIENFNPSEPWRGFQEGNAWQYTFYVPHYPKKLIKLIGKEQFNNRLDSIFQQSKPLAFGGGKTLDAFSGLHGLYNHGNQPNLHVAWLFNYSGKPSLTQKWVQEICNNFYGTEGVHGYGYGQDEDQGQLGAWYVMAAMGLFDVGGLTSSSSTMGLSTPLFDEITIALNTAYFPGRELKIVRENSMDGENKYIQQIRFGKKKVKRPFLSFVDLTKGGIITYQLGNSPKDNY